MHGLGFHCCFALLGCVIDLVSATTVNSSVGTTDREFSSTFSHANARVKPHPPPAKPLRAPKLSEHGLLLRAVEARKIAHAVLAIELDGDLVPQAGLAAVQPAGLDDDVPRHDVQLGEQAGAAVRAEEVVVLLPGSRDDGAQLGGSLKRRSAARMGN